MRRRRRSIDRALARMRSPDAEERARALRDVGFHPFDWERARPARRQVDQVFAELARLVRGDENATVRREASYVLAQWHEMRAARVLLDVLRDGSQSAVVRGHAAEGLGVVLYRCDSPKHVPIVEDAKRVLRDALNDAAADVRFWCIYALAQLMATESRKDIEVLLHDDALCPNMWRVSDEARDALHVLDGGSWPDRAFEEAARRTA